MTDYTVRVVNDQHVPTYVQGGKLQILRRVQITVGAFGPFFHDFAPPNNTAADVRAWIVQQVQDVESAHQV